MPKLYLLAILLLAGCGGHPGTSGSRVVIAGYPKTQTVSLGETAEFTVEAAGKGLTYQWFHDGREIPSATSPTLRIAAATDDDFGGYTVHVIQGNRWEGTFAELRETGFPDILSESISEPTDGKVKISVVAQGDPAPTYSWVVETGSSLPVPITGETGPSLTVLVPASGGATYWVYVTNPKGSAMGSPYGVWSSRRSPM